MAEVFITFITALPAVICAAAAVYFAFVGIAGWGWFLFTAVIITSLLVKGGL